MNDAKWLMVAGVTYSYQSMKATSENYLSSHRQFSQRPDMLLHKFLKITYSQPYQMKDSYQQKYAEILLVYTFRQRNIPQHLGVSTHQYYNMRW